MGEAWKVIRADVVRRWNAIRPLRGKTKAHGANQKTVAAHGGLAGQNAISRILNNKNKGPNVETFVRGLIGMGVKPSVFFAALEDQLPIPAIAPAWGPAANALPTAAVPSPADDLRNAQRARALEAWKMLIRLHELMEASTLPVREVRGPGRPKKAR
jgi:transcriptional regulator with XRE-family HTH domain